MLKSLKPFMFCRDCFQYILLLLVLMYFLAAVLYRLDAVLVLNGDDVENGVLSQYFLRLLLSPGSEYLDLPLLLMRNSYVGQLQQYLAAMFLVLFSGFFGLAVSFKLTMVFLGVVSLVSIFLVLRYLVGPWIALLTVFFMGTNCVYIQSVRYGFVREEILQIAGLWFGLCLFVRGYRSRNQGWIYAGLFVFGLTLWAKMMFAGYMVGAFAGMVVLGKQAILSARKFLFPSLVRAVLRIGAFGLGVSPLVFYNLIVDSAENTASGMLWQLSQQSGIVGIVKWLAGIFRLRMYDSMRYLLGTLYRWDYGANWFGAVLILCALIWCIRLVFVLPEDNNRRRFLVFVLVSYFVLLLLTCFITVIYWAEHVIILVPFTEMLCAVFVADICQRFKNRRAVVALAVCVVGCWLGFNVRYEAERNASRNSLKGYLPKDFLVSDMKAIVVRLQELGVRNLYCGECLSGPVDFFLPHEWAITIKDVECDCYTGINLDDSWYLLTRHEVLADEDADALRKEYWPGVRLELVEVFDTPLSCYPKVYLHRIKKT